MKKNVENEVKLWVFFLKNEFGQVMFFLLSKIAAIKTHQN